MKPHNVNKSKIVEKAFSDFCYCSNCIEFDNEQNICNKRNETVDPLYNCGNFKEKKLNGKEQIKAIEESKKVMNKFIFDPNKVFRNETFTFCRINKDLVGFGLLLPKEQEITNKNGKPIGTQQILAPVIIDSESNIVEIRQEQIKEHKIKFGAIPSELNLRWGLRSINDFLKRKYPKIDRLKLFNKIKEKYEKYLYFQNEVWYSIHTLWDIGTYFFMLFNAYPIFELRGLKGGGKTKTMTVSGYITLNSTGVMVNPSESILFRETNDKRPTKYIDEAEKLFTFQKGSIISDPRVEVINSSYSKNGAVPRIEKIGNKFVPVHYHTYSPTMVGSINGLYGATEDRAIIHISVKSPSKDTRGNLEPSEYSDNWEELRNELYIFTLQNWKIIENIYNSLENDTKLKNRDYQIWKPILTIAKFINEELYKAILEQAEKLTDIKNIGTITEGSIDYNIINYVYSQLPLENKKEEVIVLISDIKLAVDNENNYHSKTIAKHMDNFGFREFKGHFEYGNGYKINKEIFENLIIPIFPSFASFHSEQTEKEANKLKVNEERV